jgi:uncharacterized membrane protein
MSVESSQLGRVGREGTAAQGPAQTLTHARTRVRVQAIDILRGLVIVLMALDHVREYFTDVRFRPLDLTHTDVALFFTRWITHYCAPLFIFLAGVSAWLVGRRCTRSELTRFLVTRGLWLVVLEFTLVSLAWTFNLRYDFGLMMQVIWAIGVSMIVLALLARLPLGWITAIAATMIAGHNLLDGIEPETFGVAAPLWAVLHVQQPIAIGFVSYPLIPWIGVMALGYVMGGLFELEPERRRRLLLTLGSAMIVAFVVLRLANVYGDPHPWSVQSSTTFTVLSFLKVHKYPPSLLYLLMTLGPGLLLLVLFETWRGALASVLEVFGRVPLFFYVLHIVLAHALAGLVALWAGYGTSVLTGFFPDFPPEWGYGLPMVYGVWLLVLALLYPLCRWFAEMKRRRSDWWLSYL